MAHPNREMPTPEELVSEAIERMHSRGRRVVASSARTHHNPGLASENAADAAYALNFAMDDLGAMDSDEDILDDIAGLSDMRNEPMSWDDIGTRIAIGPARTTEGLARQDAAADRLDVATTNTTNVSAATPKKRNGRNVIMRGTAVPFDSAAQEMMGSRVSDIVEDYTQLRRRMQQLSVAQPRLGDHAAHAQGTLGKRFNQRVIDQAADLLRPTGITTNAARSQVYDNAFDIMTTNDSDETAEATVDKTINDENEDTEQYRGYVTRVWAEHMDLSQMSYDTIVKSICPLCIYDMNDTDGMDEQMIRDINAFAEKYAGEIPDKSLAFLLSMHWNNRVFKKLANRDVPILPLTYSMAFEHISEPHRMHPAPELKNDIKMYSRWSKALAESVYERCPETQKLLPNEKISRLKLQVDHRKWAMRGINMDKMAFSKSGNYEPGRSASYLNSARVQKSTRRPRRRRRRNVQDQLR